MEDTSEKEIPQPESKDPEDEQGGIRRRLRDRDLLRKRKAEAEEKATNQAQAPSKKRDRRAPNSTPAKKGRPRKEVPGVEPQPLQQEAAQLDVPRVEEQPAPLAPAPVPAPDPKVMLVWPTLPILAAEPQPVLTSDPVPLQEIPSSQPPEEVLIQDLGPDEEDDKSSTQENLVVDEGANEEPADPNNVFSIPMTSLTPPQQEYPMGIFVEDPVRTSL